MDDCLELHDGERIRYEKLRRKTLPIDTEDDHESEEREASVLFHEWSRTLEEDARDG